MKKNGVLSILTALALAFCTICTLSGIPAEKCFADGYSGQCGYSVKYELSAGNMRIYGTGPMWGPLFVELAEWSAHLNEIVTINVEEGVTSIGDNSFTGSKSLTSVTIGNGVTSIGKKVFANCTGLKSVTIPSSVTYIADTAFDGCGSLTIYGASGSYAQGFAQKKGIAFSSNTGPVIETPEIGDVDGSGKIEPLDALYVLQHCAEIQELSVSEFTRADVSFDNRVTPIDAVMILRMCAD